MEPERRSFGGVGFGEGDLAVLEHLVQDEVAASHGALGAAEWGVVFGTLGEGGQEGGLLEVEVADVLGEVELACGLEAIGSVAKVDLVGVKGEDLLLGEAAFDLDGEEDLLELTAVGLLSGEEEVAGELHGDGRGALGAALGVDVLVGGLDGADEIDAPVSLEALVLDGDNGVAELLGEVTVGDDYPALEGEGAEDLAVDVQEFGGGVGVVAGKVVHLWEVDGVDDSKTGHDADHCGTGRGARGTRRGRRCGGCGTEGREGRRTRKIGRGNGVFLRGSSDPGGAVRGSSLVSGVSGSVGKRVCTATSR